MGNLALNKNATASGFIAPYNPAKAVDGAATKFSRWLCESTPGWLCVDLGASYWVNRWVVKQMGVMGWSPTFNMSDFALQGSLDNVTWFAMDSVINNTANQTDRATIAWQARYVRIYVTKGLKINNPFSSISEFEVYEASNSPYLTNLLPSTGSLFPAFAQKVYAYTVNVDSTTPDFVLTPTAGQSTMMIKVNGTAVTSGQQSQSYNLNPGSNPFTVTVTSADNTMTASYAVNVVKAGAVVASLSALAVKNNRSQDLQLVPQFVPDILTYAASVANGVTSVTVVPDTTLSNATITVNGISVTKASPSNPINLNVGSNTITVVITASGYASASYTIAVTRAT